MGLRCELACWREDEGLRFAEISVDPLENGDGAGGGFTHPSFGLDDDISA